jgi:hypothetical protein
MAHDKKETVKKTKYTVTSFQVEKFLQSFEVSTTFNSPQAFRDALGCCPMLGKVLAFQ